MITGTWKPNSLDSNQYHSRMFQLLPPNDLLTQRQPIVSARYPPTAAPRLLPMPYARFIHEMKEPLLRRGTKSEIKVIVCERDAPAPRPQRALAKIKCRTVGAIAHQSVPMAKATRENKRGLRRPKVSESLANTGLEEEDVRRKDVENHGAALDAENDVDITGWDEAIRVESKDPMNHVSHIQATSAENRSLVTLTGSTP